MRHEAVEDVAVDTHEVVGAVAAVGSAAAGHLADEGLSLELPCGAEVVLHVEADVVAADFLLPFLAEGGGAAAVGHHHDVSLLRHQAVAPAVAPVLAVGTLRAAEDYGDGGIDLALVELGRIHHPGLHTLSVDGADLPALAGRGVELLENGVVLVRDGLEGRFALRGERYLHQFGGEVERHIGAIEFGAFFGRLDGPGGAEIVPPVAGGETFHPAVERGAENALHGLVHEGVEIDLVVAVPHYAGTVVVEVLSEPADAGNYW